MNRVFKYWVIPLILNLFFVLTSNCQNATGLIFDDNAYQKTERMAYGLSFADDLPQTVSLKAYCPPVKDQGDIGSCVGWASAYAAYTIATAKQNGTLNPRDEKNIHSPMYVFNQIKRYDCNSGSSLNDAMSLLKSNGSCPLVDFNPGENCFAQIPQTAHKSANNFKALSYANIYGIFDGASTKIINTKRMLAQGKPVVIGMYIPYSFYKIEQHQVWQPTEYLFQKVGAHAMCVVGYNELDETFEIMNSWGTDWGNNGFFKIGYTDFAKWVKYGYVFNIPLKKEAQLNLSGEFNFFNFNFEKGEYVKLSPEKGNKYYTLNKVEQNDFFRLKAQNMVKGSYVYVFSLLPNGQTKTLYPKTQQDVDGSEITPLPQINSNTDYLNIPYDLTKGLTVKQKGENYLCILYSSKKIDDFPAKVKMVQTNGGTTFFDKVNNVFGKSLVSQFNLNYAQHQMKVSANKNATGHIAPLILKVDVK